MNDGVTLFPVWRQAVADAARTFQYGDLIPMEWLHSALEISSPEKATPEEWRALSFQLLTRMDYFRDAMLKEHKMALVNIRGRGYQIVAPSDHAEVARQKLLHYVAKGLEQAKELIEHTAFDRLTQEEIQKSREMEGKLAAFRAMGRRALDAPKRGRL